VVGRVDLGVAEESQPPLVEEAQLHREEVEGEAEAAALSSLSAEVESLVLERSRPQPPRPPLSLQVRIRPIARMNLPAESLSAIMETCTPSTATPIISIPTLKYRTRTVSLLASKPATTTTSSVSTRLALALASPTGAPQWIRTAISSRRPTVQKVDRAPIVLFCSHRTEVLKITLIFTLYPDLARVHRPPFFLLVRGALVTTASL